MIGETVYHYRILDKIGEGGMGVVYRAEDIKLRRIVALKFLSPMSVLHGSTREKIMKEARAAASLDHQNICAIHEVEELDDKLFIVMAYCEGSTLGDLIRDERPELGKTLNILIQIADGLLAAHEQGIIHRDIKPANVIVSDKGKVKIMDFGLAKQTGGETMSMTMAGAGTLGYMSPEQVRGGHVDHRSDIWSLGILMYQMLTGRRPFEGDYDASVLYSIVNEKHEPAMEFVPEIPLEINTIVERALEKSPDDRYGTMEEMRNALILVRNILFGEPETVMTWKGFFPGKQHIFGWKLTSVLALSVSVVMLFFIIRHIIAGGDRDSIESVGSELAAVDDSPSPESSSDADMLYELGQTLYNTGNQPEGIPYIEQALKEDPEHFESLITLAAYYSWGSDSKKAIELIDRARKVAKSKGDMGALILCAAVEAKVEHNWEKAVFRYREWYEDSPAEASILIHIGYILSKYIGDYEGALEQFELYFEADPQNLFRKHGTAHNYTGTALLYSGDFDKAMKSFRKYQELFPDSPDPVTSIAGANLFIGNYEEAYLQYYSLLAMDDPPFTAYEGLGNTCIEMGRLREAHEHFHLYLGKTTSMGQVNGRLHLARIYFIQKDKESFDREMSRIKELNPESIRACWLRGVKLITMENDVDRARGELIKLTALMEKAKAYTESSRREHLRGLILLSEGRNMSALNALKEAGNNSPREFFFFGREYARALLQVGKADEAIAECQDLSNYNPNDPQLLMILCKAYSLNGDMISAKENYDRTLEVLAKADEDFIPLIEFKTEFEEIR